MKTETQSPDLLYKMDEYWRAANHLSAGQVYLYDNPLFHQRLLLVHAVFPILQLNICKISNPTLLARIGHEELETFFLACGWMPIFVKGKDVVDCLPELGSAGAYLKQMAQDKLIEHKPDIDQHGQDLLETRNWKRGVPSARTSG